MALPDDGWAEALIAAIRKDAGALGSARAIETLRAWQIAARGGEGARAAAIARSRLAAIADALNPPFVALPRSDSSTASDGTDTDTNVPAWRAPPVGAGFDEDKPTRALPPPLPPKSSVGPAPKPRASIVRVRALYTAILPLCRELLPLPYERRSRRFWSLWRETSGDRGVRREVVEEILKRTGDLHGLAGALIAEVQGVDAESVHLLLQRIEADGAGSA
ncbi:MAG: hypothetical protein U1E65_17415 [Myxococcota bacterium]